MKAFDVYRSRAVPLTWYFALTQLYTQKKFPTLNKVINIIYIKKNKKV